MAENEIQPDIDLTALGDETAEIAENSPDTAGGQITSDGDATTDAVTDATNEDDAPAETASADQPAAEPEPEEEEEISYHAVQKDDSVSAIWEMQGRRHLRTIDPRSREGAEILRLFTADENESYEEIADEAVA